mmetsp:Transcript_16978/g.20239  ORF Transcript_16978/g.20239 Transcript_16978/m.20239 type:complete len:80 (+) Transcript_16978:513-752(+)
MSPEAGKNKLKVSTSTTRTVEDRRGAEEVEHAQQKSESRGMLQWMLHDANSATLFDVAAWGSETWYLYCASTHIFPDKH